MDDMILGRKDYEILTDLWRGLSSISGLVCLLGGLLTSASRIRLQMIALASTRLVSGVFNRG